MSPGDIFFIYLIKVVKYKVARFVNVKKLEEVKREKVTYENDIENMVNEKDKNSSHFNIGKIKKVKSRKEIREERKREKEIKKDLKKETKKIKKNIPDLSPLEDINDNNAIRTKDGIIDIYQIPSFDISSMNIYEAKGGILAFTKLLKMYKSNLKIIAMNFPTNTQVQKDFIRRMINSCNDEVREEWLKKEYRRLEAIEVLRSDREYYCMIFANDEKDFESKNEMLLRCSKNLGLMRIDREKKLKIIYKLNNMNSKIN